MSKTRKIVASSLVSAAMFTGLSLGAPVAQAAPGGVRDGHYTHVIRTHIPLGLGPDIVTRDEAWVRGKTLTVKSGKKLIHYRIKPTKSGGVIDRSNVHMVLARGKHGWYAGQVHSVGIPVGRNTLIPR